MLLALTTNKYYVVGVSLHVIILIENFVNVFKGDTLSSDENHGTLVSHNQPSPFHKGQKKKSAAM